MTELTVSTIQADIVAGIALAGLLVPEGMAYVGIAGVPSQAGLYSAVAGLIVYALFGSSRHLAVSCTSGSAVMVAALVAPLAVWKSGRYFAFACDTAVATGVFFLLASAFRLASRDFPSKRISRKSSRSQRLLGNGRGCGRGDPGRKSFLIGVNGGSAHMHHQIISRSRDFVISN
jgi:hypothetical protein